MQTHMQLTRTEEKIKSARPRFPDCFYLNMNIKILHEEYPSFIEHKGYIFALRHTIFQNGMKSQQFWNIFQLDFEDWNVAGD